MSRSAQRRLSKTGDIKNPGRHAAALRGAFKSGFFDETEAPQKKGRWRELAFRAKSSAPLHLEIGPGNGSHFARLCLAHPEALFLAVELRYKSLAQTLRLLKNQGSLNGKAIRYNAAMLDQLFDEGELNSAYIHFPDPWPKKRHAKHRLVSPRFAEILHKAQKPLALLEFKTDDLDYFKSAVRAFQGAGYKLRECAEDLHRGKSPESADKEFWESLSLFEAIFFRQGLPIGRALLQKAAGGPAPAG